MGELVLWQWIVLAVLGWVFCGGMAVGRYQKRNQGRLTRTQKTDSWMLGLLGPIGLVIQTGFYLAVGPAEGGEPGPEATSRYDDVADAYLAARWLQETITTGG